MPTQMLGLFLDDEREIEDVTWVALPNNIDWTIIRTFDDMVEWIQSDKWEDFEYITFDHDLNQQVHETGVSPDGYTLIKMLVDRAIDLNKPIPKCLFHTQNPIGRENMESYYFNYLNIIHNVAD